MEKRIYRSRRERMIGGVAGGIAEYFEIDPVIVRFAFIALTLFNGIGLILYIVGMVIIPDQVMRVEMRSEDSFAFTPEAPSEKREKFSMILGVILIVAGVLFGLDNFVPQFDISDAFPLILVLLGVWIIIGGRKNRSGVKHETE